MQTKNYYINDDFPCMPLYIVGNVYEGKGTYLGKTTKGVHKFEKHTKSFTFARANNFGPKYHFEKA